MSGTYEIVINNTKKIESLLESKLGATGRGLHTKVESVQKIIDLKMAKKIHYIATIRNKLMHEDGFEIADITLFEKECKKVIHYLSIEKLHSKKFIWNDNIVIKILQNFGMPIVFFIGGFIIFFLIITGNNEQQVEMPFVHVIYFCLLEGYFSSCLYWGFTSFNNIPVLFKIILIPLTLIGGIIISPIKIYQGVKKIKA